MPCRWSCLQLPRIRFDRVHVPMKGRNDAERLHFPPRIGLCPVPWHASFIPPLDTPWPRSPRRLLGLDESPGNQRLDTAKGCTPPTSTGAALTRRWRRGEGWAACAPTQGRGQHPPSSGPAVCTFLHALGVLVPPRWAFICGMQDRRAAAVSLDQPRWSWPGLSWGTSA